MWRITWRCFNHGEESYFIGQTVDRSPYTGAIENMGCPGCGMPMKMSRVEDLRGKAVYQTRIGRVKARFQAKPLELFESN
jgi:hypothetical protein